METAEEAGTEAVDGESKEGGRKSNDSSKEAVGGARRKASAWTRFMGLGRNGEGGTRGGGGEEKVIQLVTSNPTCQI